MSLARFSKLNLTYALLALFVVTSAGCASTDLEMVDEEPNPSQTTEGYVPFNPVNLTNQEKRVQVYQDFANQRSNPTAALFTQFSTNYVGGLETTYGDHQLQIKVLGREDDHTYATLNTPELGAELDGIITDAVIRGEAEVDGSNFQQDLGHIIDKTLLRFFYLSIYHEMFKGINKTQELFAAGQTTQGNETAEGPKNWDEAFGYFGLAENGVDFCRGVCATVEKRAVNFPSTIGTLKTDIFKAFIQGKNALIAGDFVTVLAQRDFVDQKLLFLFAVSCAREFKEYQTQDNSSGKATKLAEARIFVDILEPFIRHDSPADADTLRAAVDTYDLEGSLRMDVDNGITAGLISNEQAQAALEILEAHFDFLYEQL